MLIDGEATDETDARGRPSKGDTLLVILNGGSTAVQYPLPPQEGRGQWTMVVNTTVNIAARDPYIVPPDGVKLEPYSLVLLRYGRERRVAVPSRAEVAVGKGAGRAGRAGLEVEAS
jgi:hypothetical protein